MRAKVSAIVVSLLAVGCPAALLATAPANQRHASDGFIYPGLSAVGRRYNDRWSAYMRRLPVVKDDPEQRKIDWMRGTWTAQPRDFPKSMTDPSTAELSPATAATADWTAGRRWLRISFVAEPWHAEWDYLLGHDAVGKHWILQYIASPSLLFSGAFKASGWRSDRLVFAPIAESYRGFTGITRFVIVRTGQNSFRIVSEVKMPSGRFVAMDDVLFTRGSDHR
jgi:hypothetical protein